MPDPFISMADIKANQIYSRRVDSFGLLARAANALINDGIVYVAELIELNMNDLQRVPNLGVRGIRDIQDKILEPNHLALATEISGRPSAKRLFRHMLEGNPVLKIEDILSTPVYTRKVEDLSLSEFSQALLKQDDIIFVAELIQKKVADVPEDVRREIMEKAGLGFNTIIEGLPKPDVFRKQLADQELSYTYQRLLKDMRAGGNEAVRRRSFHDKSTLERKHGRDSLRELVTKTYSL